MIPRLLGLALLLAPSAHAAKVIETTATHRVIEHPGGMTRVPLDPKRIVSIGAADALVALGRRPIAHLLFFGDFRHYLKVALKGVRPIGSLYGSFAPDLEAVWAAKPDLILVGRWHRRRYAQLAQIAPTVIIAPARKAPAWEQAAANVHAVGAVLGLDARAARVVDAFEAKGARVKALVHARLPKGATVATIRAHFRQYRLNGRFQGGGPILYDWLGLTPPPIIRAKHWRRADGLMMLSPERLLGLEVDHLFTIIDPVPGSAAALEALKARPVWQRLPAARAGHVYPASMAAWQGGGLLGMEVVLDEISQALAGETLPPILEAVR